jgi:hypothetical protein
MTKKAAAKPKKKQIKKHSGLYNYTYKHTALVVVSVIALFAVGFFAFNQYQISQEKKQFADAEAVLNQLSSAIQLKLGAPISSETVKQCAYASAKYTKGAPRCSVSTSLRYKDINNFVQDIKSGANSVLLKASRVIVNGGDLSRESQYGSISNDFTIIGNPIACGTSISAASDDSSDITINIGCYKDTKKEYFPVKN